MGYRLIVGLVWASIFLSACGGGGSTDGLNIPTGFIGTSISTQVSPNGTRTSYVGNKSAAAISNGNATQIVNSFYGNNTFTEIENKAAKASESENAPIPQQHFIGNLGKIGKETLDKSPSTKSKQSSQAQRSITETGTGSISGSYTATGTANDNGTGSVTFTWNNFNDGDGFTLNGRSSFHLIGLINYDNQYLIETDIIQTFDSLTVSYNTFYSLVNGETKENYNPDTRTRTIIRDYDLYESASNTWISYDNLKYEINENSGSYRQYNLSGRYYHSAYGYVQIRSSNPLLDCYSCSPSRPKSGGPLLFEDESSGKIALSQITNNTVRIQVNDVASAHAIYNWADLNTPLPNNPPTVRASLDPNSPKNGDTLELWYDARDSDNDDLYVTIKWYVNNQIVISENTKYLTPDKYETGDTIRVEVIVSDGIDADVASDSVDINHNYPIANAGPDIEITNGNRTTLNAGLSSDPENRPITYEWSTDSEYISFSTPNSRITEVISDLAGNSRIFTITLKVTVGENISSSDSIKLEVRPQNLFKYSTAPPISLPNIISENTTAVGDSTDWGSINSYQIGDITGDNKADIVYLTTQNAFTVITVLERLNEDHYAPPVHYRIPINRYNKYALVSHWNFHNLQIEDMNNDGLADIVAISDHNQMLYLTQKPNGKLELNPAIIHEYHYIFGSSKSLRGNPILADINDDGLKDIVINNYNTDDSGSQFDIFFQQSNHTFTTKSYFLNHLSTRKIAHLIDINNNGKKKIVVETRYWHPTEKAELSVYKLNGNNNLIHENTYDYPFRFERLSTGDFNDDNKTDLIFTLPDNDMRLISYFTDTPFSIPVEFVRADKDNSIIRSIDLNGDGMKDFVASSDEPYRGDLQIRLMTNQGLGILQELSSVYILGHLNDDAYIDSLISWPTATNRGILPMYGQQP